jgi:CheY-like chemotaxis protein
MQLIEYLLSFRPGIRMLPSMQGRLGIDLARQHRPDLIFLDLHLPDMRGDEVLRRLRADGKTRDIPVVIISADATPGQIARLKSEGADEYLTKPLDVHQLLATLDRFIEQAVAG